MPAVRIGIVGCGRIVRLAHLRALRENPDARVVAIADPQPESRAYCTDQAPSAAYFPSFEAMLAGTDIEAVVIAVPPPLHREMAVRAFEHGLHVYLEKPIAASFADGQAIVDAWRRAGTVGRIGFNCRFNALYREMHDRLAAGDIGAPVAVRTALTACWPSEEAWRLSPTDGGGALLELASHHVDLLRFLFEAEIVHVTMASWSNRGIDEAAMLQLQLASGLHVQTLICYGTIEEDHFAVYGGEGKLVIDRYNSLAVERAPLEAAGGISSAVRRLVREIARLPYGWRKRRAPGQEPSFASSLAAFVTSVRDCDSRALPSLEDGLAALAVIDAARIAAKHPNGAAAAASR